MTALSDAAAALAIAGYEVLPLRGKLPHGSCFECTVPTPDRPNPHYRPHKPADCAGTPGHDLCHGCLAATSDPTVVSRWWRRWPQGNIGARIPKSLLILDVDPRADGDRKLGQLEATHQPLPPTRVSYSGRGDGGRHLWFLHPGGTPTVAHLRRLVGPGLDLKSYSGYAVMPPSRHPDTGQPYRWAEPLVDPAPLPRWLRDLLLPPPAPATPRRRRRPPRLTDGGDLVEQFNAATSWAELLEPLGWTCLDGDGDTDGARWRHPSAAHQVSANVRRGWLYVYSQSTSFEATEAGAPHGYSPFGAWAVLEHGGDRRAAFKALREQAKEMTR